MGVPYRIVIEEQEYPQYLAVIEKEKILVLDKQYQRDYDPCDSLSDTKSKGSGPARNFAGDHSIANGSAWHWVMDDNIRGFFRLQRNLKTPVGDGTIFRCMEDFVGRYTNVAMAGPNYFMFAWRKDIMPPFVRNTRIFSCNLIRNDIGFRWRGRYNEDADLSLRMLKAGWCTILFNAFLQYKMTTQTVKGGNTTELYGEGTGPKSKMLVALHPDAARLSWKFGRIHHHVNYLPFKKNRLILRDGIPPIPDGPDNYGMKLISTADGQPLPARA
jgi:hypothetical protein